jgi:folate-binding protein YgfZ
MFSAPAYRSARERAASLDRSERGLIVVSGNDRASYLQGLLTNDVMALKPGEGCYAAYLTPQGRMIADVFVYELGDVMLMTVPRGQKDIMLAKLDQLIFSEDVQLGDVTDTFVTIGLVGPEAADALRDLLGQSTAGLDGLSEHGNLRAEYAGHHIILTRTTDTGEAGYDVYVESGQAAVLRAALVGAGVPEADAETADVIRIEAGVPKFNRDMDEDTIPLEAGIESRAISFSKGCYVGQEVIIRVLHRGHGRVARKLVGLVADAGPVPPSGTRVMSDSREIGKVTSGAMSLALQRPIALAYLHRDYLTEGTEVTIEGRKATVIAFPFVKPDLTSPAPRRS